jgi:hypothetical protein
VPSCSDASTAFLPASCSNGTTAAEETASRTAAGLPPPGVLAAPAKHAFHLYACSQTSVESTHIH